MDLNVFALSEGNFRVSAGAVLKILFLFKCRLSPCEWSQPETEQNTFSFLHSLWYTAGALTLQGKHQLQQTVESPGRETFVDLFVRVFRRRSSP